MSSFETALQATMAAIPDCLASGCLDAESGLLLATGATDTDLARGLDRLGGAVADLFQGAALSGIGRLLAGPTDGAPRLPEMVVFSDEHLHVFLPLGATSGRVICYVCRKAANVGLVLARARAGVETLARAA
ncbi:hypothetical protein [Rubellimicrobium roseum]|uniref:Roadblock/LAMTOR2 domain-containing protein n=1 Tax=Rubellimicrobium roseum TaxID=687525 RepID=A0A5C4NBM6_9RHOB|nr:hypothetical protein [Rubellimicrobium roseum]TNC72184.1 hypothetical protein FHG71_09020 [Rubellimicrobium roseum]